MPSDLEHLAEALEKAEQWQPIPGWPYEASDLGRLRSLRTNRILHPSVSAKGYEHIVFQVDKARHDIRVHRAVALAWIGPIPVGYHVNHLDGDKRNNRPARAFYVFGPEDGTLGSDILSWCPQRLMVPTRTCMNLAATVNVVLYDRLAKADRCARGIRNISMAQVA